MAEQRGTSVPSLLANVETTPSAHCRLSFASANFRFLRAISTVIPSSPASRRVVRANPSGALADWRMQTSREEIKKILCSPANFLAVPWDRESLSADNPGIGAIALLLYSLYHLYTPCSRRERDD